MAEAWHIGRCTRTCAGSGRPIEPGQPFYSALIDKDDSFERRDYSADVWAEVDKGEFFSYWKNKGLQTADRTPPMDYDRLLAFFDGLEGAEEPGKRLFRYVLALVLVRRRRLRLDDMSRTPEGDRLVVWDRRNGGRTLEILAPEAGREELEKTQEKLNELFDCDFSVTE